MKAEKEHWFVAEIYTKKPSMLCRGKIFKFMVKVLPSFDYVNFHFFHEDWDKSKMSKKMLKEYGHLFPKEKKGYMFLFRVRLHSKDGIKNLHKEFDKYKYLIKEIYKKIKFPKYYGEQKYYSEIGWHYVQEYFYYCSLIALYVSDIKFNLKKAKWLRPSKLVHTFLNQLGINEFNFHLNRALSIYNNFEFKHYPEVKKAMEELNKFLKKNESKQIFREKSNN